MQAKSAKSGSCLKAAACAASIRQGCWIILPSGNCIFLIRSAFLPEHASQSATYPGSGDETKSLTSIMPEISATCPGANFIRHRRELFGMDFIFREIPLELVPFDFQTFNDVPDLLVIGTTDVETAEAVYYAKGQPGFDLLTVLRASSSLPLLAPIVEFDGRKLMDGGISDPIPIRKAERDGYARNVLILTRNEGYVKSRSRMRWLLKRKFGEYPAFVDLLLNRHQLYNDTVAYIEKRAADGAAFIVRPSQPLTVGRLEQNRTKLEALYKQGYDDAAAIYPELIEWLG